MSRTHPPPRPPSLPLSLTASPMKSFLFVALILLAAVLQISNGFVVAPSSSLNVRRQSHSGMQMLFGGGGAKKKAAGGIVVKVQQKTGFKETELTLAGKTNLRKALMDNKIDIYPLQVSERKVLEIECKQVLFA